MPDAVDWRGFAVVSLLLLTAAEKVFGIGRWLRRDPERREVSFALEHPSKEEFEAFRTEVKADVSDLHEKINRVDNTVSATRAQCEMINTNLLHLSNQVKRKD